MLVPALLGSCCVQDHILFAAIARCVLPIVATGDEQESRCCNQPTQSAVHPPTVTQPHLEVKMHSEIAPLGGHPGKTTLPGDPPMRHRRSRPDSFTKDAGAGGARLPGSAGLAQWLDSARHPRARALALRGLGPTLHSSALVRRSLSVGMPLPGDRSVGCNAPVLLTSPNARGVS
jgi:hypothetical protein